MLLENTYWPESDDPYSYFDDARPERNILTPGNRQVAREVAAHSFVLLKNDTVQQLESPALKDTGKPLVLVVMAGRPLAMEEEHALADAILLTWHPGVEAGHAIADVLLGNYNPSGKLTMTFPRNVGQIPIYYAHRATGRPQDDDTFVKFRSNYLDIPNSPLYPFGYGLSYTTFSYSNILLDKTTISGEDTLEARITVANTGEFDGEEVVQLYIRDVFASITRPVKELKGFQKIQLNAGESREVTFTLSAGDLKFYNFNLEHVAEPGEFKLFIGGSSLNNALKEASFVLE